MIPSPESAFHFIYHNRSYWMPFLISPSFLPSVVRMNYNWRLLAEVIGHLLTASCAVKVMHINMNILQTYTIGVLSQINMITRIILIVVEVSGLTDGIADSLLLVCLIKTFAWVGVYNYVTYVTLERYAALIFSADYENNRRVWIPFLLILGNSLISGLVAFLLVYEYFNGIIYVFIIFCANVFSCAAFMLVKAATVRLNSFDFRQSKYSVSQRWQTMDNVRMVKDTRFLVLGAAIQISFYLPFFFVPPIFLGDKPEGIFQLISSYGFAIAELFGLFAFSRHTDYVRSEMGFPTRSSTVPPYAAPSDMQTMDDYFDSLNEQWELRGNNEPRGTQL